MLIQKKKKRELERKIDLCLDKVFGRVDTRNVPLDDRDLTTRVTEVFALNGLEKMIMLQEGQFEKINSAYLITELIFRFIHSIEQTGLGYTVMTTPDRFKHIVRRFNSNVHTTSFEEALKCATLRVLLNGRIDLIETGNLPILDVQCIYTL